MIVFIVLVFIISLNNILAQNIDDIVIDDKNRKILHLLSQGVKTKNLAAPLDISLSAVEKRKKQLRDIFEVYDGQDETLLNEARKKGFV